MAAKTKRGRDRETVIWAALTAVLATIANVAYPFVATVSVVERCDNLCWTNDKPAELLYLHSLSIGMVRI